MTQPKINLSNLKKHLKTRSQAELIADIAELYKRFQAEIEASAISSSIDTLEYCRCSRFVAFLALDD